MNTNRPIGAKDLKMNNAVPARGSSIRDETAIGRQETIHDIANGTSSALMNAINLADRINASLFGRCCANVEKNEKPTEPPASLEGKLATHRQCLEQLSNTLSAILSSLDNDR